MIRLEVFALRAGIVTGFIIAAPYRWMTQGWREVVKYYRYEKESWYVAAEGKEALMKRHEALLRWRAARKQWKTR